MLVTGPTGSGKTTTLAAMIDHINNNRSANIITIEDPIEVLHRDKMSIISQREIGTDTRDWSQAMRRVLRQDPDVILIGEMRDPETIQAALSAGETGHLVLSTLHTTNATETINRIVDFFPPFQQRQVRISLAAVLRGVISQRLVARADGVGRVVAVEAMVMTGRISDRILDPNGGSGETIEDVIADGEYHGMVTFDQSLFNLFKAGEISLRGRLAGRYQPSRLPGGAADGRPAPVRLALASSRRLSRLSAAGTRTASADPGHSQRAGAALRGRRGPALPGRRRGPRPPGRPARAPAATSTSPPTPCRATEQILARWGDSVWAQGKRFGTIGAAKGATRVEVTTHRAEQYGASSRKPEVVFSTALEVRPGPTRLHRQCHGPFPARPGAGRPVRRRGRPGRQDGCGRPSHRRSPSPTTPAHAAGGPFHRRLGLEPGPELVEAVRAGASGSHRARPSGSATSWTRLMVVTGAVEACGSWCGPGWPTSSCPSYPALALEQDPIHRHKDVLAHTLAVVDKTRPDRLAAAGGALPRRRQAEDPGLRPGRA